MFRTVALAAAAATAAVLVSVNLPSTDPVTPIDVPPREPVQVTSGARPFIMFTEVYGDGSGLARSRLDSGLANGVSIHPDISPGERDLVTGNDLPFLYFSIPEEAGVAECYPASTDPDNAATIGALDRPPSDVIRLGMPEFDQSGGCWSRGRPSLAGLSDSEAYSTWSSYYLETKGLRPYLTADAAERGYLWASLCGYAFCPQYAYDLGSDVVLLERNNDEVSGLSPGLAMVRGAAMQNGDKPWGIDFSTYRYWNRGPTVFDESGRLVTGWSPSTFERNMYAAYMGGADLLHNEAVDYESGATQPGGLNPLGEVVAEFADFALRRHPDRGEPEVTMAVLQDHQSGYEPRYGAFDQAPQKWYRRNPYTPGDTMLDAIMHVAYPGHEQWGTIVPGAPWEIRDGDGQIEVEASQDAYQAALADGADPRAWEPMSNTRWGESVDVVTDRAGLDTLNRYPSVVLSTTHAPGPELLAELVEYVRGGGTLVLSSVQLSDALAEVAGVRRTGERGTSDGAVWTADGSALAEPDYRYDVLDAGAAEIIATTAGGDPLVTRSAYGEGTVYVASADHMVGTGGTLMAAGERLLDEVQDTEASVEVTGQPLQYLVNTDDGRTTITLVNTDRTGQPWSGTLQFRGVGAGGVVAEDWTSDTTLQGTRSADGTLTVRATVPPYGVRVISVARTG